MAKVKFLDEKSPFRRGLQMLSENDVKKLKYVVLLQIFLGGLDLVGVALIGILGALSITGVESQKPGNRVGAVLRIIHLDALGFQGQCTVLGLMAGLFLVSKTILSVIFTKRSLSFLAFRAADISKKITGMLLSQQYLKIQERSIQQSLFAITGSVNSLIIGVMGSVVAMVSDFSLIFVMLIGLFVVDPITAFGSLIFFGLIAFAIHKNLSHKAHELGRNNSILSIENNELVVQALTSFREIYVRNRQDFYLTNISKGRYALANIAGEMNFMPNVSKYVLEASVVVGGLLLATSQFMLQDAKHAFATLAVFLAAASRIAPALLRLQQGLLQVRTSSGGAMPAIDLYDDLSNSSLQKRGGIQDLDLIHEGFEAEINFQEVCFKYPGKDSNVLTNISLNVKPGEILAIVGPSGAGKTTLVDLMIGLIPPTSGHVEVSGMKPSQTIITYPGAISYVPQDISIINDTVAGNICLGFEKSQANINWISEVTRLAMLDGVIADLNDGINTFVGERGTKLSGGQRQRLGIARALFTNPKLIILDEATSALDAETENLVSNSINNLRGKVTVVLIAHRLATVRTADKVCYLEDGVIKGFGNFDEVRSLVPNFDKQANLLGLK